MFGFTKSELEGGFGRISPSVAAATSRVAIVRDVEGRKLANFAAKMM